MSFVVGFSVRVVEISAKVKVLGVVPVKVAVDSDTMSVVVLKRRMVLKP